MLAGLEWPEQPQDAESELDEINAWITTEFFRHWGRQDANASLAALDKLKDGQREYWAKCGLIPFVPKTMQNAWVKELKKIEAEQSTLKVKPHKLWAGWAVTAPHDALAAAEQIGKDAMGACLLVDDSCGPAFKEYVAAIQPYLLKVSEDDLAWYVLEAWGDIDSELTVTVGINWLLTNEPKRKSRLIKEWTNKIFVPDGGLEDRIFGNLRYWAFTQPKAMEKWIAKQPDAQLRKPLTWLLKHAKGVPYQPTEEVP